MKIKYPLKEMVILLVAFLFSIAIRLPNLNRPLSKHHEFVNACTLNGVISWQDAGGAYKFNYVPLMTYQGPSNRLLVHGAFSDSLGNQFYLSVGPGWYVAAYLIFQLFHTTANLLGLQLINLFFNILTLASLYGFLRFIMKKYTLLPQKFAFVGCLFFLFMPGPLWYFGNVYVQSALSLPFAIVLTQLFLKHVFYENKLTFRFFALFFITGVTAIYMDWFAFFLLGTFFIYSIFQFLVSKKLLWAKLAALCAITSILGVLLIFVQFTSLLGWHNVLTYWQNRASNRSFNNEESSIFKNIISFLSNFVSCTGIAIICSIIFTYLFIKKKKGAFPLLPTLFWGIACIAYNLVFFNWSYIHEFSMMPFSILIAVLAAYFILKIIDTKISTAFLCMLIFLNIIQYYYINRPGKISRTGIPYNTEKLLGEQIKKEIPVDYRVFSNLKNGPIVEYYAHRSIALGGPLSLAEAKMQCDSFLVPKAVWLKLEPTKISEIHILK